jgi:hypothetical protein
LWLAGGRQRAWIRAIEQGTINLELCMKTTGIVIVALALSGSPLLAQDRKPVPKDSVRVFVPGCTKGMIFTAARRTEDQPSSVDIPEGMHLRMNGPKKLMADIKAHEGSKIEITGLMKKGQYGPDGIGIGGGIRIAPAPGPGGGGFPGSPGGGQNFIDVEGWRPVAGSCPSR